MPISSSTQAAACLRAALRAGAENPRAGLGTGIAALILALLVRLFGRTEAAWFLSPNTPNDHAPHTITMPVYGRAPHAEFIETGRFPDWILPGIRNRGMRPSPRPVQPRRKARPARAPPPRLPRPVLKSPPNRGAQTHAPIHSVIKTTSRPAHPKTAHPARPAPPSAPPPAATAQTPSSPHSA